MKQSRLLQHSYLGQEAIVGFSAFVLKELGLDQPGPGSDTANPSLTDRSKVIV